MNELIHLFFFENILSVLAFRNNQLFDNQLHICLPVAFMLSTNIGLAPLVDDYVLVYLASSRASLKIHIRPTPK
jgi:hypothetical protein